MDQIQIILLVMMAVVFYFLILRPQRNKAKEQDTFLDELTKGDRVVTTGGIIGKVTNIDGPIITLALDNKTTCKFTKGAISKEMTDALDASGS